MIKEALACDVYGASASSGKLRMLELVSSGPVCVWKKKGFYKNKVEVQL